MSDGKKTFTVTADTSIENYNVVSVGTVHSTFTELNNSTLTTGVITSNTQLPVSDTVTLTFDTPLNYFQLGEYTTQKLTPANTVVVVTLEEGQNLELPGLLTIYPVIVNSVKVGSTVLDPGKAINRPSFISVNTSASQITVTKTSLSGNFTDVTYTPNTAGNFTINNLLGYSEVFIGGWGSVHFAAVTSVTSSSTGGQITNDTNLLVGDKVTLTFDTPLNYFKLGAYTTTLGGNPENSVEVTLVTGYNLELPGVVDHLSSDC